MEEEIRLNDIADDLLILNKHTIDVLFSLDNCTECIALYLFYYKTAKWQKTNVVKATDEYVKKSLKWGIDKIRRTKNVLKDKGLIRIVQRRNDTQIEGWFVEVCYLVSEESTDKIKVTKNTYNQQVVKSTSRNQETNALKYNINNTFNEMLENNNSNEMLENNILKEIQKENAELPALPTAVGECVKSDNIFLTHWNSLEIIKHKNISDKSIKKIKDLIKKHYTEEQIMLAMDRYNQILKDDSYYFSYKWTLEDFLCRKGGIESFMDNGEKWLNYLESKSGKKAYEKEMLQGVSLEDW